MPLNGTFVLRFDEPLDPLSLVPGAVVVSADGVPLEAEIGIELGSLAVRPVVSAQLLARPPARLAVRVAGGPALRGLRTASGSALESPVTVAAALSPVLADETGLVARLVSLQGRPPSPVASLGADGRVLLVFEGVLDPATITPASCAVSALQGGLVLPEPIQPEVRWRCVARRFELELRLPAGAGSLQLALRRTGLRDLAGRVPEPPLVAELRPAS
jgi:hypothetical protein